MRTVGSVRSTSLTPTPNLLKPLVSRVWVQPYSVSSATISSPAFKIVHSVAEMAPMPEAVASAASPPSKEAIFSSTCRREGLPRRG